MSCIVFRHTMLLSVELAQSISSRVRFDVGSSALCYDHWKLTAQSHVSTKSDI